MYLELDQRNIREQIEQLLVDADYQRLHLLLQCPTLKLSVLKLFVEFADRGIAISEEIMPENYQREECAPSYLAFYYVSMSIAIPCDMRTWLI